MRVLIAWRVFVCVVVVYAGSAQLTPLDEQDSECNAVPRYLQCAVYRLPCHACAMSSVAPDRQSNLQWQTRCLVLDAHGMFIDGCVVCSSCTVCAALEVACAEVAAEGAATCADGTETGSGGRGATLGRCSVARPSRARPMRPYVVRR
jgi:hypothetical protein